MITSLETARAALDALGLRYKYQNGGLLSQCPTHDDQNASCSISPASRSEQSVVVKCFAGCDWRVIKQALESALGSGGLPPFTQTSASTAVDRFGRPTTGKKPAVDHGRRVEQARYPYRLADGSVAFTKVRYGFPDSPKPGHKTFSLPRNDQAMLKQLKADGAVPVYNLPELKACIASGTYALAGEGEKDCDTARRHGRTMICGHAGAGQRLPEEYAEQIRGLRLLWIVPDNDDPGTGHALNWMALARRAGVPFKVVRTPLEVKGADLTDHFQAGHGWEDLLDVTGEFLTLENGVEARSTIEVPTLDGTAEEAAPTKIVTLAECDNAYQKWMSSAYDLAVVHASLAVRAAHELAGEPVWLLVVAGSASGKTEGIAPLASTPNTVMVSEIVSPGALLSGTSNSERSKDATGGLLNQVGASGTLILKDFTTILSMGSDARNAVLAALREVYDGSWTRHIGTDGGKALNWAGRVSLVGATTTTYDRHHAVIASMGDRFALIRMDSQSNRRLRGMQALLNTGNEREMREELGQAAAGVIAGMDKNPKPLDDGELEVLFKAADYVTTARTPAERDYKGEPIQANEPEMPQRFGKMLQQIVLGGSAIGIQRRDAMALALRVAHDSIPPVRRKMLEAVQRRPQSSTSDVVEETQIPRTTVDRMLQELALQGLLVKRQARRFDGAEGGRWQYCLAEGIDPNVVTPAALSVNGMTVEGEVTNVATSPLQEGHPTTSSSNPDPSEDLFAGSLHFASGQAPEGIAAPAFAEHHVLVPVHDIAAETCDDHLVASDAVIRNCLACQESSRMAAA